MNCIQGFYGDDSQGLVIRHDKDKLGLFSLGTSNDVEFKLETRRGVSIVTSKELVLRVPLVRVPAWSNTFLPSYISVDSDGYLVQKTAYGYILMAAVSAAWFMSRWW